jgi:hypothetical protein
MPDNPTGGFHDAGRPTTPQASPGGEAAAVQCRHRPQKEAGRSPGTPSTIINSRLSILYYINRCM